jgi:hypothetical protein
VRHHRLEETDDGNTFLQHPGCESPHSWILQKQVHYAEFVPTLHAFQEESRIVYVTIVDRPPAPKMKSAGFDFSRLQDSKRFFFVRLFEA